MKERNGVTLKCLACTNDFYVPAYRALTAKFCSLNCQNHKQYNKFIFNCIACGKQVIDSPSRLYKKRKYCSIECVHSTRITLKDRRRKQKAITNLKRGTSGRSLRKYVFELKEKKCCICGYNEYDFCLDVHHIDEDCTNNLLINLAVLCCMCHRKIHKGIVCLK